MVDVVGVTGAVGGLCWNDFADEWCRGVDRACETGGCRWVGDGANVTGESVVSADVGGVGIWTGGDDFGGISTSSNVHGGGGIDDGDRPSVGPNGEVVTLERKEGRKKSAEEEEEEVKQQKDHHNQNIGVREDEKKKNKTTMYFVLKVEERRNTKTKKREVTQQINQ